MSAKKDVVTKQVLKQFVQGQISVKQINRSRTIKSRVTVSSPYAVKWPTLSTIDEENICNLVETTIIGSKVRKASGADESVRKQPGTTWKDWNQLKKKRAKKVWASSKQTRVHLALGLSQVIRSLEKDQLCALLLCRDVEPTTMIEPLLMLCASRDVHAAAVSNLGSKLRTALNFKSCRALGLKRSVASDKSNSFHTLYMTVKAKAVPLPEELRRLREPLKLPDDEDDDSDNKEFDSNMAIAMSPPQVQVVEPVKDYSNLYIKKVQVAMAMVQTSGPSEDFLSLEQMPGKLDCGLQIFSSNLISQYKEMNVKRLQPSGKGKVKRKRVCDS